MFNTLYHLFSGKRFEFDSPYSLDETRERLYEASERDRVKPTLRTPMTNLLLIMKETIDKQSYRFHAEKDLSRTLHLFVDGLVKQDFTGVHVTGAVTIGSSTLGFLGILIFLCLGIFFLASPRLDIEIGYFISVFGILFTGTLLYVCKQGQDKLYMQVHEILGKSKKKKH